MMKKMWGRSASIDLHEVDRDLIRDPEYIKKFARKLCRVIKMHRVGETEVRRFGHKDLRGYSMIQFIETSLISAHFDEVRNRAFIDVFSCQTFEPRTAAKFCQKFFRAKNYYLYKEERK